MIFYIILTFDSTIYVCVTIVTLGNFFIYCINHSKLYISVSQIVSHFQHESDNTVLLPKAVMCLDNNITVTKLHAINLAVILHFLDAQANNNLSAAFLLGAQHEYTLPELHINTHSIDFIIAGTNHVVRFSLISHYSNL